MILVRIIVTNRKKPAVWGSTATEIFSIRQRVCLLLYNSAIDHKGHLLGVQGSSVSPLGKAEKLPHYGAMPPSFTILN